MLENGSTIGRSEADARSYGPVAMQKVVGSSPIIRSQKAPETGLFHCAS